jgi:hypothetical protein
VALAVGQSLTLIGRVNGLLWWLASIGAVLSLAGPIMFFGRFVYLRSFALRIPDPGLAASTRIVMWGFTSITALSLLLVIWGMLVAGTPPGTATTGVPSGPAGAGLAGCVFSLAVFVFGLWYLVLLFHYARAFREAIAYGRLLEMRAVGA